MSRVQLTLNMLLVCKGTFFASSLDEHKTPCDIEGQCDRAAIPIEASGLLQARWSGSSLGAKPVKASTMTPTGSPSETPTMLPTNATETPTPEPALTGDQIFVPETGVNCLKGRYAMAPLHGSHSVHMQVTMPPEDHPELLKNRQWILNIGQEGVGAEHWLWTAAGGRDWSGNLDIQFGYWGSTAQIQAIGDKTLKSMLWANSLTTVYNIDTKKYTLYVDGELFGKENQDIVFHITSWQLLLGIKSAPFPHESDFLGCIHRVDIWDRALTEEELHRVR